MGILDNLSGLIPKSREDSAITKGNALRTVGRVITNRASMTSTEFNHLSPEEKQQVVDDNVVVKSVPHGFVRIADFGHNTDQKLVNCEFEDGTTKHVPVQELIDAGIIHDIDDLEDDTDEA